MIPIVIVDLGDRQTQKKPRPKPGLFS